VGGPEALYGRKQQWTATFFEPEEHPNTQDMSLRDYIAVHAMQALLSQPVVRSDGKIARFSYQLADAMIEEREE
jgi:hypothetical protein